MEAKTNDIQFILEHSGKDYFLKAYILSKKVGYVWFSIDGSNADLNFIEVKSKYRKLHIGSTLLDIVEDTCRNKRADRIDGKFYPKEKKEIVLAFYQKNGYRFYRDGYEQYVGKYIPISKKKKLDVNLIEKEKALR